MINGPWTKMEDVVPTGKLLYTEFFHSLPGWTIGTEELSLIWQFPSFSRGSNQVKESCFSMCVDKLMTEQEIRKCTEELSFWLRLAVLNILSCITHAGTQQHSVECGREINTDFLCGGDLMSEKNRRLYGCSTIVKLHLLRA